MLGKHAVRKLAAPTIGEVRCAISRRISIPLGPPIGKMQGRSQDLVSGGGPHPFRGGPTPYFSPQTPNHKGPPLCTFGYPRISGGARAPPNPPGYALGKMDFY